MSVTGTKSSGSDFVGLNEALKHQYTEPMQTNIEGEMEVADAFKDAGDFETVDGPDGKQINIGHYLSAGGGVSFMNEDDTFIDDTPPEWKQGYVTIPQLGARVTLSGRTLRRVKAGPAAFATWAEQALTEKAKRVGFHKDRALMGTGTGIIGRINGAPDGTGDAIDDMFGISGLGSALPLIGRGDALRYGPNADGSSLRTGNVVVAALNFGADTFNTTVAGSAATATSAADNDYVFLGDGNVNSAGKEFMGLEGMIDDGTNVTTFQGLTRSAYPETMYAQVVDSSTYAVAPGTLGEDVIDYADSLAGQRAGGKTDLILVNRSGQRSFWRSLKGDRQINDPQGQYVGGKRKNGLRMILGDREVIVKAATKVPVSRAYGVDTSVMRRFKVSAGRWDDTTGAIWNRVLSSGAPKDAVYALWVEEEQYACFYPARCWKIKGLSST